MNEETYLAHSRELLDATRNRSHAANEWQDAILSAVKDGMSQTMVGYYAGVSQQRIGQIVNENRPAHECNQLHCDQPGVIRSGSFWMCEEHDDNDEERP